MPRAPARAALTRRRSARSYAQLKAVEKQRDLEEKLRKIAKKKKKAKKAKAKA